MKRLFVVSINLVLNMKVSVVIPTYYRPDDLSELFGSLLRQTIKPMEIVVIDDTPSDVVKVICKRYEVKFKDSGIKLSYFKNPKERSAAIARNFGINIVKGEIVLFLDSDVILYPEYVEKILEVFKNNPNAVGVQGWIIRQITKQRHYLLKYFIDQSIRRLFSLPHVAKNKSRIGEYPVILTKIMNCETLSGSNMAIKRDILKEFKFDENLKRYSYMEDVLFSYSVFKQYPQGLYITPYARCIHKVSGGGRMGKVELGSHLNLCRKYVLAKLFGWKGALIYYWQNIGLVIITLKSKIGNLLDLS